MKKPVASASTEPKARQSAADGFGNAALNLIIKDAYRRHARGRLARAAMASCLGR